MDGTILTRGIPGGDDIDGRATQNCPDIRDSGQGIIYSPDGSRYAHYLNGYGPQFFVNDLFTGKLLYYADLSKYISNRSITIYRVPSRPVMYWVDNYWLFFLDWNTDCLNILDINTGIIKIIGYFPSAISDFYVQEMQPSPDGKYILIQSGKSGSINLFLVNTDGSGERNLTADIGLSDIYQVYWSPNSMRFAFGGGIAGKVAVVIMNIDGTFMKIIKGDVGDPKWSPDGKHLAYTCNTSISFNLCVSDADCENSVKFQSRQRIAGYETTWSPDGKKILYIAGVGDTYQVHVLWPDQNIDIRITTVRYLDFQNFGYVGYQWSPDSEWLLINGGGTPLQTNQELGYVGHLAQYATALLCDLQAKCHSFDNQAFDNIVLEADWALTTASWHTQNILPQSDPKLGTQIFLDTLTTIDNSIWNTNGKVSIASSDVGTVTRLIANSSSASLTKKTSLNTGEAILVRLRFDSDVKFQCGISNTNTNQQGQLSVILEDAPGRSTSYSRFKWKLVEYSNEENFGFYVSHPNINRWYYLFLRVRNNNQVEAYLIDPITDRIINGFSLVRDQNWSNQNWVFSCQLDKGILDLYHYEELDFQSP